MKATSRNNHETEIKLRVSDAASARRKLVKAGFRLLKRRIFEENTVFDTPGLKLRKQSCLLRLRRAGKISTLTYKGPPIPGPHKSREELETELTGPEAFRAVLERLGYRPVWRYEKFRAEYRHGAGVATIDETPIGVFVELEGPPDWIDRTARRLGFAPELYIKASYGSLYLDWRRENHRKPGDMTFGDRAAES
jgi:adenylate cyclase, class 2